MPKWTVQYTTETEPKGLPAGAAVTKTSDYPMTVRQGSNRVDVHRIPTTAGAVSAGLVATLKVNGRLCHLTEDDARTLSRVLVDLATERRTFREKQAAEAAAKRAAEEQARARLRAERIRNNYALSTYGRITDVPLLRGFY
ncbi:MAG: hypothetical protein ABIQ18_06855 [Umezawaea sp.]